MAVAVVAGWMAKRAGGSLLLRRQVAALDGASGERFWRLRPGRFCRSAVRLAV